MTEAPADLPGAELVAAGVEALRRGEWTVEALLVAVGARRLVSFERALDRAGRRRKSGAGGSTAAVR